MPVSSTFAFPGAAARRAAIHRLFSELASWHGRHRQRLALAELDDWLLADIGVTPHEARHESAKPFWR